MYFSSFFTDVDDHDAVVDLLLVVVIQVFFTFAIHRCSFSGTVT